MCKCGCSEAVSVPVGPQGPAGENCFIDFKTVPAPPIAEGNSIFYFNYIIPTTGDYILQFNCFIGQDDTPGYNFISRLRKNGINQTSNINYEYITEFAVPLAQDVTSSTNETHTHNTLISAIQGDTVGFQFVCNQVNPGLYQNIYRTGSVTIFKKTT